MANKNDEKLMSPQWLEGAAECLRVMAHPARLKMIELMTRRKCNVKELAEHCQLPHNQACEHLRLMKSHGLLESQRDGREVYYTVVSSQAMGLLKCMEQNCSLWVDCNCGNGGKVEN